MIGCGAGCGGFILLLILGSVLGGIWMARPMNDAVKSQEELTEAFGSRDSYIPGPQGLTPDRLKIFLQVRHTLMINCIEFARIGEKFQAMEELDKQGDEVPKGEAIKAVGGLMGSVMGLAAELGKFTQARNEALLAGGMGQGEYIWIYVLAYHSWLGYPAGTSFDPEESENEMSNREKRTVGGMMERHVEALREAGLEDRALVWEKELRRMERSETGVPFLEEGLPADLVAQLVPFERDLQKVFCPETVEFELNQIKKKGLSYHSN
jgi:hypothetical protein